MRVPDLFSPRAIPIVPSILVKESRARRVKGGPPDDHLRALSDAGLTLRQIADQVGLSHETVRHRLAQRNGRALSTSSRSAT